MHLSATPERRHPARLSTSTWLLAALGCSATLAQEASPPSPPKAIVALVGDIDRFTIGQGNFCAPRTDIDAARTPRFRVPAGETTYFFVRTRLHTSVGVHTCEGDFSFTPAAELLHLVRYTMDGKTCRLEVFNSPPGGTPVPVRVQAEAGRVCLAP